MKQDSFTHTEAAQYADFSATFPEITANSIASSHHLLYEPTWVDTNSDQANNMETTSNSLVPINETDA